MNCSFVQLLEDRFRQQLWDVVSEAIKEDNARGLPVKIRTVNIRYIDTAVLLQCEDYAKFPTILSVETSGGFRQPSSHWTLPCTPKSSKTGMK